MSGSNSSAPDTRTATPPEHNSESVSFTVHRPPNAADALPQRTLSGRLKMFLVMLVCAAPVAASYFTYYVIRPEARTNYAELIQPQRPLPGALPFALLDGTPVAPQTLTGQWLLVVVADGACKAPCERQLYLQRQLREMLGREKERFDKVWLITDGATPRPDLLAAVNPVGAPITLLRAPRAAVAAWLAPAPGQPLEAHFYVVDPMGNWMMRSPINADPAKFKRDLDRLLRASASWDQPGR